MVYIEHIGKTGRTRSQPSPDLYMLESCWEDKKKFLRKRDSSGNLQRFIHALLCQWRSVPAIFNVYPNTGLLSVNTNQYNPATTV